VEKVSGQSFGEFRQTRILGPLGMKHTVYEPETSDTRLAHGYTSFALSAPEAAVPEEKDWLSTAGGIYSTPSDLALWDLALMGGNVRKPESFKLMTTARQLPDGTTTEYGCAMETRVLGRRLVFSHGGAVSGFRAWNQMIPSTKSAVILPANSESGLGNLPRHILDLLLI
jgi:CubicO group peptidase (beta-lactamase class C family)